MRDPGCFKLEIVPPSRCFVTDKIIVCTSTAASSSSSTTPGGNTYDQKQVGRSHKNGSNELEIKYQTARRNNNKNGSFVREYHTHNNQPHTHKHELHDHQHEVGTKYKSLVPRTHTHNHTTTQPHTTRVVEQEHETGYGTRYC